MSADRLEPTLREVAEHVERMGSAAVIVDAHWTLVWVSPEMQWAMGSDESELGVGKHLLECYLMDSWCQKITEESRIRGFVEEVPYLIHDTPGGKQRILDIIRERADVGTSPLGSSLSESERRHVVGQIETLLEEMEVTPPPAMWHSSNGSTATSGRSRLTSPLRVSTTTRVRCAGC